MLSGKAPFQSNSRDATPSVIMERIRGGEFNLDGKEWNLVSEEAKEIIQGRVIV